MARKMTRKTPLLNAIDGPVYAEPKVDIIDDQKYRRLWLSPTIPSGRDIHGPALVALDRHAKGERTKRMISRDKQKNRRKRAKRRKQKNNPKTKYYLADNFQWTKTDSQHHTEPPRQGFSAKSHIIQEI